MYATDVTNAPQPTVFASSMNVGDIARVVDSSYNGEIVIRVYDALVSLSHPNHTWSDPNNNSLEVELLPAGSVVKLTVDAIGAN
jgi:hypothetical protein